MAIRTRRIAGREITLEAGRRYLASRPMVDRRCRVDERWLSVKITDITEGFRVASHPAAMLDPMTYDESNRFLRAFNDGASSFAGRIW